jgi:hypothetical protein
LGDDAPPAARSTSEVAADTRYDCNAGYDRGGATACKSCPPIESSAQKFREFRMLRLAWIFLDQAASNAAYEVRI